MWQYLALTYLITQLHAGTIITNHNAPEADPNKDLMLTFLVNRHGDRSPDEAELSLSNIEQEIRNLTYIEGPGGLTNTGKRRAYQIGKFIRHRYGSQGYNLLSKLYLHDAIPVRSTDKERTKMTALVAISALYPPQVEQQWDDGLGKVWQPVPYTAVPLAEDYLVAPGNCKRFQDLMEEAKKDSVNKEFKPYMDLIPVIKQETGQDFTDNPSKFQTLFALFESQKSLGFPVPSWAEPIMPKLAEAARLAFQLNFRNDEMKKISGGVLLNNFIELASTLMSKKAVPKRVRMFSGHDFNIGSLMEVTQVVNAEEIMPEYGSIFAIELYKDKTTDGYSVLAVYVPGAEETSTQYLHFKGCEHSHYCEFTKFQDNTNQFLLPEKEYYRICEIKTEL